MAKNDTIPYREVQYLRQVWLLVIVLVISGLAIYAMVQQLILGKPFGEHPASDTAMIAIGVLIGFALPVFLYTSRLITEVRNDGLYFKFFPFHLSFHRIAFEDLNSYEVRTYNAIKDYGGWGIRYGKEGKAYNISGNQGIQLELFNGEKILIGSQRPEELSHAIASVSKCPQ